ncbi:MAG: hypothetical protein JWM66_668 [Solirubrobacterales bacterium]|jgi:hypothetical protein|nr:hypothetical protein [Solirubrobacterales bacterium]
MIMEAREKRLATPLQWGRRERAVVGALLAVVVLALVGLGAYALSSGGAARRDCVDVTFASTLGGAKLRGCGQRARTICASGAFPALDEPLSQACRRAGFAYKQPG